MDSINLLVASGVLERVTLRFREDGTAVCAGSLRLEEASLQGITFKTWLQLEAYAKTAEVLGDCQRGEHVLVQGKVFWRKSTTKTGENKGALALLVQKCSVLQPAAVPAEVGA